MSALNNGGSAFPDPGRAQSAKQRQVLTETGMTLRDYFAAKVDLSPYNPRMALESKLDRTPTMAELAEYIAQIRLIEADAMLAERAK